MFSPKQSYVFLRSRHRCFRLSCRYLRQICIYTQAYHIFFKILELVVYTAIAFFFCRVYVIQLIEYHLEGLV